MSEVDDQDRKYPPERAAPGPSEILTLIFTAMSGGRQLPQPRPGGWKISRLPSGPWTAERRQGNSLHYIVAWTAGALADKIRAATDEAEPP